jgi:hypothetical protein
MTSMCRISMAVADLEWLRVCSIIPSFSSHLAFLVISLFQGLGFGIASGLQSHSILF